MKKLLIILLCLFLNNKINAQTFSMTNNNADKPENTSAVRYAGTLMQFDKKNQYLPIKGFLWLKNGEYITGDLSFKSHAEEVPTGNTGPGGVPKTKTVYYIDIFSINGNEYKYDQVAMYGSEGDRYVKDFCEYDKKGKLKKEKDDEMNFEPGFIMLNDSVKEEGFVAIRGCVLFAKTLESKVQISYDLNYGFYQPYKIKHAFQNIDGKLIEYFPYYGNYIQAKSEKWDPAYIITNDNKKINGVGEKKNKSIKYSSKGFTPLWFRPEGKYATTYYPGDIKGVGFIDGSETKEYLAFDNAFYSKKGLLENVVTMKNNDEETNFQEGSILFYDGTVLKGKIARVQYNKSSGFYFIDQNNELSAWYGDKNVKCFIQKINGVEKKFIRIGKEYTEWFFPDEKISYFRNPYPTHVREGLTNLVKFVAQEASKQVVKEVTEASVRKNIEKKNLGKAIDAAVVGDNIYNSIDASQMEGNIYFKEYVILFQDQEPIVVYAKNIKSNVNAWLLSCPDMTKIEQKVINNMENIEYINETIKTLNANGCY